MSESKNYILTELVGLQMTALGWMQEMAGLDTEQIDVNELGALTDVLKDLFECEKYVMESCYYKHKINEIEGESKSVTPNNHHVIA